MCSKNKQLAMCFVLLMIARIVGSEHSNVLKTLSEVGKIILQSSLENNTTILPIELCKTCYGENLRICLAVYNTNEQTHSVKLPSIETCDRFKGEQFQMCLQMFMPAIRTAIQKNVTTNDPFKTNRPTIRAFPTTNGVKIQRRKRRPTSDVPDCCKHV